MTDLPSSRPDGQLWVPTSEIPGHGTHSQEITHQDRRPGECVQHLVGERQADADESKQQDNDEQQYPEAEVRVAFRQPQESCGRASDYHKDQDMHPGELQDHLE